MKTIKNSGTIKELFEMIAGAVEKMSPEEKASMRRELERAFPNRRGDEWVN